jgi:hypothetical protein
VLFRSDAGSPTSLLLAARLPELARRADVEASEARLAARIERIQARLDAGARRPTTRIGSGLFGDPVTDYTFVAILVVNLVTLVLLLIAAD